MAEKMRAVDIKGGTGNADTLFINPDVPKPTASQGEAIVKVKAFGLNRMDLLQREGNYPVPPQASKILGVEFSGTIESFGEGVTGDLKVGDEVFGLTYGGAYAEYVAVNQKMVLKKPEYLSWEEAAGIPETWMTATQALHFIGSFTPGKSILWHAGASSVSIAGIQLAKSVGASQIYITAGSQEKIYFCINTLGATAGYNHKTQDWAAEILKATNDKGVDIIIDFIGKNYFQENLDVAAKDGRIVHLGAMSGTKLPEGTDISAFVRKRLRFEGSSLRSRDVDYQGRLRDKLEEYLDGFRDGRFRTFVDTVLSWTEIVDAHEKMEGNGSMGKIICVID